MQKWLAATNSWKQIYINDGVTFLKNLPSRCHRKKDKTVKVRLYLIPYFFNFFFYGEKIMHLVPAYFFCKYDFFWMLSANPNYCWHSADNLLNYSGCCAVSDRPLWHLILPRTCLLLTMRGKQGKKGMRRVSGGMEKPYPRHATKTLQLSSHKLLPLCLWLTAITEMLW